MKKERKELYCGNYLSLFSDGTFGHCDGVGFVGVSSKKEVKELYKALKKYYENKANRDSRVG